MLFDSLSSRFQVFSIDATTFAKVEASRLSRYKTYWNYYLGNQNGFVEEEGESQISVNYCKAFVDKGIAFLMGKDFNIGVPKGNEELLPTLNKVWIEDNDQETLDLLMAQCGAVTGDLFIKVTYQETDEEGKELPKEEKKVRIIVLDSATVYPDWDIHDRTKMKSCTIVYPIIDTLADRKQVVKWYKEYITPTEIVEFLEKDEIKGSRRANILGEIPIVHIKNFPIVNEFYGASDLRDIIYMNKEFNEKVTDISEIINYHQAPVTIIKGAKAHQLEKGAKKVWSGLPSSADVFNLELNGDLGAAVGFLKTLKLAMHEVSGVPEATLGQMQPISNTSGVALHIQYQPLLEKLRIKRATYGKGIQKINKLILKLLEIKEGLDVDKLATNKSYSKYKTQVLWPDPLPKDELIAMNLTRDKMELGLIGREQAMKDLGYSPEIINEMLTQADKEQARRLEIQRQQYLFEQENFGIGMRGGVQNTSETPAGGAATENLGEGVTE